MYNQGATRVGEGKRKKAGQNKRKYCKLVTCSPGGYALAMTVMEGLSQPPSSRAAICRAWLPFMAKIRR